MTDKYEFEPFDFSEEKVESLANTTPINDIHAIQAEQFEERRPITLEEMRDLDVFFGNRGINIQRDLYYEGHRRKPYFDTSKEAKG